MGTTWANTQMLKCFRLSRYQTPQQDKTVDVVSDRARMDNHSPIRYQATDSENTFVFKEDSNDRYLKYLEC